jgi:ABC-type uncharacterized transport system fused permease/ATPase subunit
MLRDDTHSEKPLLGTKVAKLVFRLVREGLVSPLSRGSLLLYLAFFLVLLSTGATYMTSMWSKEAACAITCSCDNEVGKANIRRIVIILAYSTGSILFASCASQVAMYIGMRAGLFWRQMLVRKLHKKYLNNKNFYDIVVKEKKIDNPDQRITSDVRDFVALLCGDQGPFAESLIISLFASILNISVFTYLVIDAAGLMGIAVPLGWCLFGSLVNFFLARRLPAAQYSLEKREGNMRFAHMRIRTYAESIAFFGGESQEKELVDKELGHVIKSKLSLYHRILPLTLMSQFLSAGNVAIPFLLPLLAMIPTGKCTFNVGDLMLLSTVIRLLVDQLLQIPKYFSLFGALGGFAARVGQMLEILDMVIEERYQESHSGATVISDHIELQNITVTTPNGKLLVKDLSLVVDKGKSLVITGLSGVGKSSILRTIAGLWEHRFGTVLRPPIYDWSKLFFVPQKSYLGVGSLRQQIIYPRRESEARYVPDVEYYDILKQVGLDSILTTTSLDTEMVWEEVLSPGEVQRLGFARVLYHKPEFIFLDESTSALDLETESKCMQACVDSGATLISVAHRPTVIKYHQRMLQIQPDGSYVLKELHEQ